MYLIKSKKFKNLLHLKKPQKLLLLNFSGCHTLNQVWWNEPVSRLLTFVLFRHAETKKGFNVSVWKPQRIILHQQSLLLSAQTWGIYLTKPCIGTRCSHVPPLTPTLFVLQYLPKIYILSPSPFFSPVAPPHIHLPPFPSVPLSPLPTLPGEGGAGSAADVGGGAQEARGGREEAPGRDGPPAAAGGGGGEDEGEALLAGQWSRGRWRRGGRGGAEEKLGCTAGSKAAVGEAAGERNNKIDDTALKIDVTYCNDTTPVWNGDLVQANTLDNQIRL